MELVDEQHTGVVGVVTENQRAEVVIPGKENTPFPNASASSASSPGSTSRDPDQTTSWPAARNASTVTLAMLESARSRIYSAATLRPGSVARAARRWA